MNKQEFFVVNFKCSSNQKKLKRWYKFIDLFNNTFLLIYFVFFFFFWQYWAKFMQRFIHWQKPKCIASNMLWYCRCYIEPRRSVVKRYCHLQLSFINCVTILLLFFSTNFYQFIFYWMYFWVSILLADYFNFRIFQK